MGSANRLGSRNEARPSVRGFCTPEFFRKGYVANVEGMLSNGKILPEITVGAFHKFKNVICRSHAESFWDERHLKIRTGLNHFDTSVFEKILGTSRVRK